MGLLFIHTFGPKMSGETHKRGQKHMSNPGVATCGSCQWLPEVTHGSPQKSGRFEKPYILGLFRVKLRVFFQSVMLKIRGVYLEDRPT